MLLSHMEKDVPSLPEILHNTDRPHNAYDPDLPVSYRSAGRAGHHAAGHPLQGYNVRHLLQPDQFRSHGAS